jgi:hypothetical protein
MLAPRNETLWIAVACAALSIAPVMYFFSADGDLERPQLKPTPHFPQLPNSTRFAPASNAVGSEPLMPQLSPAAEPAPFPSAKHSDASFLAGATRGHGTQQAMEAALLQAIPIASPIEDVQTYMEQEGFDHTGYEGPNADYLHFERYDAYALFVSRRWQVSIYVINGTASKLSVNQGLIGL